MIRFPDRVWEPAGMDEKGNLIPGWVTRPATDEDHERRRNLLAELSVSAQTVRQEPGLRKRA